MEKRLTRSRTNYMWGGVCGGLGAYFQIDATIVRLFFVLLAVAGGAGVPLYLVLWLVIPREDRLDAPEVKTGDLGARARLMGQEIQEVASRPTPAMTRYLGIALVMAGVIFLLRSLGFTWLSWLNEGVIWALILILGGAFLLLQAMKRR
jgi:phage shock protein C